MASIEVIGTIVKGKVACKFNSEGFFWRAHHYAKDDSAILALDL